MVMVRGRNLDRVRITDTVRVRIRARVRITDTVRIEVRVGIRVMAQASLTGATKKPTNLMTKLSWAARVTRPKI